MAEIGFYGWLSCRIILIVLAYVFLVKGIDHLVLTLFYALQSGWRMLIGRGTNYPKEETLRESNEKPGAILLPCPFPEQAVSVAQNYLDRLEYENFRLFLGIPEDTTNLSELNKFAEESEHIELISLPRSAAHHPAGGFNCLYDAAKEYESTFGVNFSFIALFTANGSPHPLCLKYFNFFIDKTPMIQLPLLTMLEPRAYAVNGVFVDEFSESYSRDMSVRAMLSNALPSAGTGAAFSRDAVVYLADQQGGHFLDPNAVLPLQVAGLKLKAISGNKLFLEKTSAIALTSGDIASSPGTTKLRPVAVYERFPFTYRDALLQKARWTYGCFERLKHSGFTLHPGAVYFHLRDLTLPFFQLLTPLAYLVAGYILLTGLLGEKNPTFSVPPLLEKGEPHVQILSLALLLAALQVLVRALLTARNYGAMHAFLSVLRYPLSHVLNAHAAAKAMEWCMSKPSADQLTVWNKPPAMSTTGKGRTQTTPTIVSRLGDILVKQKLITPEQLTEALQEQQDSGTKLGEVLLKKRFLQEEDLVFALADQNDEEAVEIDPYATPIEVLMQVPRSLAERYRVFPMGTANNNVVLATDVTELGNREEELSLILGRPVVFQWTSSADIGFAIEKAYARMEDEQIQLSERLGPRLLRTGIIDEEQLKSALRQQKRSKKRLGDVLVEMEMISRDELEELLK